MMKEESGRLKLRHKPNPHPIFFCTLEANSLHSRDASASLALAKSFFFLFVHQKSKEIEINPLTGIFQKS